MSCSGAEAKDIDIIAILDDEVHKEIETGIYFNWLHFQSLSNNYSRCFLCQDIG